MSESFDLIVIGAGPGGYVCAIRAAQLGMKVACVEKRETLGGTCLNIGCIPSKALLQSSENFEEVTHGFKTHGIMVESVKLDLARMQARKGEVVSANVKGVEFLFKKNKVTWLKGEGRITAPGRVAVDGTEYETKNIVIATGSESIPLPGLEVDEKTVVTSTGALELDRVPGHLVVIGGGRITGPGTVEVDGTAYETKNIVIATGSESMPLHGVDVDEQSIVTSKGALELDRVPEQLVVIGGGYIGLELGSVWLRLGAKVTVVEFLDRLVASMDNEIGKQFERVLGKQGMSFKLKTKVTAAEKTESGVRLTLEPAEGGEAQTLDADVVLLAIGRRPYYVGLGLEEAGVALDERKRVKIDAHYATSVPGIYAIGDVVTGPMLAHKAEEEGMAVAEILAGQAGHVNYHVIPGVVYTWPEVASIGLTEEQLKAEGRAYNVGKFPFTANGRARAMGSTDGFVKILADKTTDEILGAHIIGPDAGTLIAEIATAMEFGASSEDVARTCHAHPSLNEAVKEAALAVEGRAIHI